MEGINTMDALAALAFDHCIRGDSYLKSGLCWEAIPEFTSAISYYCNSNRMLGEPTDDKSWHAFTIGRLLLRNALAKIGVGDYADGILELATAAAVDKETVFPLCCLASVRATCEEKAFFSPFTANMLAKIASHRAVASGMYLDLARLTLGVSLIALQRFEDALEQFGLIDDVSRALLVDYEELVRYAESRTIIRRTSADFAARLQLLFQQCDRGIE